ncbi:MAG: helix-turn-helix domain-containing protein [Bacteroidales bacterium]|nr:helix-turn-helix domain-containing protein [Bacteroidales bacterium]
MKKRKSYKIDSHTTAKEKYLIGYSLNDISILLNIPLRTLQNWQTAEKWTELKQPPEIIKRAYQLHQSGKTAKEIAKILQKSIATIYKYFKIAKEKTK